MINRDSLNWQIFTFFILMHLWLGFVFINVLTISHLRKSHVAVRQHDFVRTAGQGASRGDVLCDRLPNQEARAPLRWNLYLWVRTEFGGRPSVCRVCKKRVKVYCLSSHIRAVPLSALPGHVVCQALDRAPKIQNAVEA